MTCQDCGQPGASLHADTGRTLCPDCLLCTACRERIGASDDRGRLLCWECSGAAALLAGRVA